LDDRADLDLREPACDTCDCLDTVPDDGRRCGCSAPDPAGALPALLLLLRRRPRRP
jgi:uncharacterized protein (TIGR03382 family)